MIKKGKQVFFSVPCRAVPTKKFKFRAVSTENRHGANPGLCRLKIGWLSFWIVPRFKLKFKKFMDLKKNAFSKKKPICNDFWCLSIPLSFFLLVRRFCNSHIFLLGIFRIFSLWFTKKNRLFFNFAYGKNVSILLFGQWKCRVMMVW